MTIINSCYVQRWGAAPSGAVVFCPAIRRFIATYARTVSGYVFAFRYFDKRVIARSWARGAMKTFLGGHSPIHLILQQNEVYLEHIDRALKRQLLVQSDSTELILSVNLPVSLPEMSAPIYLNLQFSAIDLDAELPHTCLCHISLAALCQRLAYLVHSKTQESWLYHDWGGFQYSPSIKLSYKELRVLHLSHIGCREEEIASQLRCSTASIKKTKAHLVERIGANNFLEVLGYAIVHHLI